MGTHTQWFGLFTCGAHSDYSGGLTLTKFSSISLETEGNSSNTLLQSAEEETQSWLTLGPAKPFVDGKEQAMT